MTFNGVQCQVAVQVVVDFALGTGSDSFVVVVASGEVRAGIAIRTVIAAAIVAQVAFQYARTDCPVVHQTQEVLRVEVFQFAVVVRGGQVFGQLVVSATVVELVAATTGRSRVVGTGDGQAFVVAGVTAFCCVDQTASQGQVFDLVRLDLATGEGLWQQTTVVGLDDRVVRLQGTDLQFGLGNLDLTGQAQAREVRYGTAVRAVDGFSWKYAAAVGSSGRAIGATAGVQTNAVQADSVNTKLNGTLGVAGDEAQVEALAPFFALALRAGGFGSAITVIVIDVEVTQTQCGLAVFDETCGACLLRQNPYGHSQGQSGLLHGWCSSHF